MNIDTIKTAVTSKTARQLLVARKHSPKILFAAGVVGVVGTVVLACRATLQLNEVLDEHDEDKREAALRYPLTTVDGEQEYKKAAAKLNMRLALDITRLYAPAVGVGMLSVASLTGSHIILEKRNVSTMAAYAAVDRAYKQYRQRIVDTYGKDVDRDTAQGVTGVVVEEKMADGTTQTTIEKGIKKDAQIGGSGYAQVFDERSSKFTREPGMNAHFVMMAQNYANDKLKSQGHLFLNEVWDLLKLPRTKEGAVVGWIYEGGRDHLGDGYVTFNIWDGDVEHVEQFIGGNEKYAIIDPNVDGPIWDKI